MAVSCGNCGAEVDADWQFCRSCGAELEETDGELEAQDLQAEDTGSPSTPAATETDDRAQPDADTEPSRGAGGLTEEEVRARRRVTTALLIGLALLVALVGGGLLVFDLLGR